MTESNEARLFLLEFLGIWFGISIIVGIIVGKIIHWFNRGDDE